MVLVLGIEPRASAPLFALFLMLLATTGLDKIAVGLSSADPTWRECGGCGGRLLCEPHIFFTV